MIWKGKEVTTIGDLTRALEEIVEGYLARSGALATVEEAEAFREAYRAESEHADQNIGYCLGYLPHDQMVAGLKLFGVRHPMFGGPEEADQITPEKAFALGEAFAKGETPGLGS